MKRICTLILAAGLLLGTVTGASAIDFSVKGQWRMGFVTGTTTSLSHMTLKDVKSKADNKDSFEARQRVRLQLQAVASEALSGTTYFELGDQSWGKASKGAALGADGNSVVEVKNAYLDWAVPQTDAKVRMGIQEFVMPNKAGGSAILSTDVVGITSSYKFNENAGLTALWVRPLNDNFSGTDSRYRKNPQNFMDNMDLFSLALPLNYDGVNLTPWGMYGMMGKNALTAGYDGTKYTGVAANGNLHYSLLPYPVGQYMNGKKYESGFFSLGKTSKSYGSLLWAGLPASITMFDPLNIEFDVNYGYMEGMGRYDVRKGATGPMVRGDTQRQGWLAKALVEYKMDWATPGIFGWYATGDDGSVKNGSERMPSLLPSGNFTSFLGDGGISYSGRQDYAQDYSGSWGVGAQLKDLSFVDKLTHTVRVAYWGGTNSTSMVKYMNTAYAWNDAMSTQSIAPYMTTEDHFVEFNLANNYKIYDNLQVNMELGYAINGMDNSTWKKAQTPSSFEKQDMWKAQMVFTYSF